MYRTRPQFTPESLFGRVRGVFKEYAKDKKGKYGISTADCLMSAFAMFSLKYPSLLQFDQARKNKMIRHNLKALYGIQSPPCDTYMRERLDGQPLSIVRNAIKSIIFGLQRSKALETWKFLDKYYLVSLDGTGFFLPIQFIVNIVVKRSINAALKKNTQAIITKCWLDRSFIPHCVRFCQ